MENYKQRVIDLFYKSAETLTDRETWFAKGGHMGQAENLIKSSNFDNFGNHVVTHGMGAGYDYFVAQQRSKIHMDKHREQFLEITGLSENVLGISQDFSFYGNQLDNKDIVPCLAYRFGYYLYRILQFSCFKNNNLKINIMEIGGGWGLLGSLLLKQKNICYVSVDLPSMSMCCAYFLMKLGYNVLCYGEYDDINDAIQNYDVVIIPPCEVSKIKNNSIDIVFNANSFPEMPYDMIKYYIENINRVCKKDSYFYYDNLVKSDFPQYGITRLQDICEKFLSNNFMLKYFGLTPIHTDRPWIGNPKQELRDYEERIYKREK